MNLSESDIRDFLADNLDLFEKGLTLCKTEFRVKNQAGGAGGRIDILAVSEIDNCYVVIELKKGKQSPREACQEIIKYTALLRETGISAEQIRCIIASVDWHDLLIAAAELKEQADYALIGKKIVVADNGEITLNDVVLQPLPKARVFCSDHLIFFYQSSEQRQNALPGLQKLAGQAQIEHFVFCLLDYAGINKAVIFPFAVYLAFAEPIEVEYKMLGFSNKESAIEEILSTLCDKEFALTDEYDLANPLSLMSMLHDWRVIELIRFGKWSEGPSAVRDEHIVGWLMNSFERNPWYFERHASPNHRAAWEKLTEKSLDHLNGCEMWQPALRLFLEFACAKYPDAVFHVRILDRVFILMDIFEVFKTYKPKMPFLEVLVEDRFGNFLIGLAGLLEWDGKVFPNETDGDVAALCGGSWRFALSQMRGDRALQLKLFNKMGLHYAAFLMTSEKTEQMFRFNGMEFESEPTCFQSICRNGQICLPEPGLLCKCSGIDRIF